MRPLLAACAPRIRKAAASRCTQRRARATPGPQDRSLRERNGGELPRFVLRLSLHRRGGGRQGMHRDCSTRVHGGVTPTQPAASAPSVRRAHTARDKISCTPGRWTNRNLEFWTRCNFLLLGCLRLSNQKSCSAWMGETNNRLGPNPRTKTRHISEDTVGHVDGATGRGEYVTIYI